MRSAAGAIAAGQSGLCLAQLDEPGPASWAIGVLVFISALSLIVGFVTPGAAIAISLTTPLVAAMWMDAASGSVLIDRIAALLLTVDALALAALGPGGYSVDAYLFGRREIIIHQSSRPR